MHTNLIKGSKPDVVAANVKTLCAGGMSVKQATHLALKTAKKSK